MDGRYDGVTSQSTLPFAFSYVTNTSAFSFPFLYFLYNLFWPLTPLSRWKFPLLNVV